MSAAITVNGSTYTLTGHVVDANTEQGIAGLAVTAYDKDLLNKDDFCGLGMTDTNGRFTITFDRSRFGDAVFDRHPDLYFTVLDGGTKLFDGKDQVIENAGPATPEIRIPVSLAGDKLRGLINAAPVPGWQGGFAQSNPAFAYPTPDLTSLPMLKNRTHIDLITRQQKVVWPEFSWNTEPDAVDKKRCYQMFAPNISRLGYTNEGRVYDIICPQQGACSPQLGSLNVEVTVGGNRGWADEATRTVAADMTVHGRIWFAPSAHDRPMVKRLREHFAANNLPFPTTKLEAIIVNTFLPGQPDQPIFPLIQGETDRFPVPAFARHTELAWSVGHLDVEIGSIHKTGIEKVDEFNQIILDIFNLAVGNMLKEGNVLSWNVWFTAPDYVDQEEWRHHAEVWRTSIDADHGSPDGESSPARYYDGSPFSAAATIVEEEAARLGAWIAKHL